MQAIFPYCCSQKMAKNDHCPEMVVVQIGSNGEEIKPSDTEDGTVIYCETPNSLVRLSDNHMLCKLYYF